jgi:hypothetical protein
MPQCNASTSLFGLKVKHALVLAEHQQAGIRL